MTEVVYIADIKQRVLATKAKLSAAASQEGPKVNAGLLDLLESVEKTLLHNQEQIRRLRRSGKALVVFGLFGWLVTAALVAERFYSDSTNDTLGDAVPGRPPEAAPSSLALEGHETNDTSAHIAVAQSIARSRQPDQAAMRPAKTVETTQIANSASTKPRGGVQDVDDLVFRPHDYQGRQVTVTGWVIQLFSRYRLRSGTGQNTIVIDIDGLQPTERAELEAALEEVGMLGGVRARIMGRIERQEAANFHLVASELVLLD